MCFRCGADSGRTSNRCRSPAVVLPFPLTELSLLKPLAMCNPPPPKPCPTTPGTYVQTQGRIGAEARKAPVVSLRLAQPAPSWEGSLKARQVWARLAPGRAASRRELCQIGALTELELCRTEGTCSPVQAGLSTCRGWAASSSPEEARIPAGCPLAYQAGEQGSSSRSCLRGCFP